MKKTDLEKRLAKKIEGRQRTASVPQRFGKGSAAPAKQGEAKGDESRAAAAGKLVTVSVRLPAAQAQRLRALAVGREGGISALVVDAVDQWLAAGGSQASSAGR